MTFLLAFALQCFFPLFDSVRTAGLATVNPDANQRNYSATVVSAAGVPAFTARFSLAAEGHVAFLLREVGALPPSGSISVESDSSSPCSSYLTFTPEGTLSGTEGSSTLSTVIWLPHVEVNTGFMELNHTETTIAVVNPGAATANVAAQLVGLDGISRGSIQVMVPSRGTQIFRVSEAFSAFIPGNGVGGRTFQGHLRLNSNVGIVAWQRIDTPLTQSLLKGKGTEEIRATTLAMIPHFAFSDEYGSSLNLLNPTESPISLLVSAHNSRGSVLGEPVHITLAPGEGRRAPVGEFFRIPVIAIFPAPLITGYIRIREGQSRSFQIVGNVEIFTNAGGGKNSAMLSPVSDAASNRWILPFASSAGNYFTGFAIANPNELLTVQTDITVEIVGSTGGVIGASSVSLSPAGQHAATILDGRTGYVRINSNLPIHVLGSIGTKDGGTLDQVPALR